MSLSKSADGLVTSVCKSVKRQEEAGIGKGERERKKGKERMSMWMKKQKLDV